MLHVTEDKKTEAELFSRLASHIASILWLNE